MKESLEKVIQDLDFVMNELHQITKTCGHLERLVIKGMRTDACNLRFMAYEVLAAHQDDTKDN